MCIYSILIEQEILSKTFLTKLSENTRSRMWVWDQKIGCLISNCNCFYLCEHRITNDSLKCQCLHIQKRANTVTDVTGLLWTVSERCMWKLCHHACRCFSDTKVRSRLTFVCSPFSHRREDIEVTSTCHGRLLGKYMGVFSTEVTGHSASMG